MLTLLHNPRCSKSRQALQLLEEAQIEVKIHTYLDQPLTATEINELLTKLAKPASQLIRTGEEVYKELNLSQASEEELVTAMANHPKLIERPVLITPTSAVIGRPPELVLELAQAAGK